MNECTKPKIVVVLAVYNGMAWLTEQLQSILKQEGVEVTIFISIDPSTDESVALCNKFASQYENIRILPNVGEFGSASKNFFRLIRDVDLSGFDYFSFADQDDIWFKEKLVNAVNKIIKTKSDGYSSNVIAFWSSGEEKLIEKSQPLQCWDFMFESAGPGCTFVISKALALDVQEFLVKHQVACQSVALHDWFIYAFARSRGYQWFIDAEPHMLYRQHSGNVVGANVGVKAKLARFKKMREGWLITQALLIAEILGYGAAWPMQRLNRYHFFDRLLLIINVTKLRRRLRDRVALALFFLWPLHK